MKRFLVLVALLALVAIAVFAFRQRNGEGEPVAGSSSPTAPSAQAKAPTATPTPTPIPILDVRGTVTDLYTGSPVVSATVSLGDKQVSTDEQGRYEMLQVLAGSTLVAKADEYEPATATPASQPTVDIKLRPTFLSGTVVDAATGAPVPEARIYVGTVMTQADSLGQFRLTGLPTDPPTITVKAAGYAKTPIKLGRTITQEVRLKPFEVKAAYLTYYSVGSDELRENLLDVIDRTELNAVVIDVKGDRGWVVYDTGVPMAQQIGADQPVMKDFDKLMQRLKERNIYTIARIVVFKDNMLALARPELAVRIEAGGPYIDWEDLRWVDPFQKDVWEYNIALAEEAARKGFDEIQFDYVRFPSEGAGGTVYSLDSTQVSRLDAIKGFVSAANARLQPLGVFTAVDLFGWTMLRDDDLGIGQLIEDLAPHVDYICPMVYPSAWQAGSAGVEDPVAQPYDIVYTSVKEGVERLKPVPTVRIRPWLQDFYDYGPRKLKYLEKEVRAQKEASDDAGAPGWMLWDPQTKYTEAALDPE